MAEAHKTLTGGCQCGAVRFRAERIGRGGLCHCRMCQKQFGSFYAPLVAGFGVVWTRGEPKRFRSSNKASRGFCADCGTPLTYEGDDEAIGLAIGAFDDPTLAAPTVQVNPKDKLSFVDAIPTLHMRTPEEGAKQEALKRSVISYQHPDRDTESWTGGQP